MFVRLGEWKWTPNEGDSSRIGRGLRGSLAGATEIDAAQYESATLIILEGGSVGVNATGRLCSSSSNHQDYDRSPRQHLCEASSASHRRVGFVPRLIGTPYIHLVHKMPP